MRCPLFCTLLIKACRESRVRLKALFDYNPQEDRYIPCREAGLGFVKGDIIHIVSQDDPYWWQVLATTQLLYCSSH